MYAKTKEVNGLYYLQAWSQGQWVQIHKELYDYLNETNIHKMENNINTWKENEFWKWMFKKNIWWFIGAIFVLTMDTIITTTLSGNDYIQTIGDVVIVIFSYLLVNGGMVAILLDRIKVFKKHVIGTENK